MEKTVVPTLTPRIPDSHKGDYGKVLVIAGSDTMIGAPALTSLAALRSGAGLVRIALPKDIIPAVLTICPYATAYGWVASRMKELLALAEEHDVLAVGPGLGFSPATKRLVTELLERHHGPMVLDADALNAMASLEVSEWPKRRDWSNVVLTPHMGEYMRLMGAVMKRGGAIAPPEEGAAEPAEPAAPPRRARSLADDDDAPSTADGVVLDIEPAAEVKEEPVAAPAAEHNGPDRTPLAELLAKGTGAVVVLKGYRTVITDGVRSAINTTGNPAMATAGSGDVLTGVIASLIGQKLPAYEAAVLAAHVHGRAGDLARDVIGPVGLLATDIIQQLPKAIAEHIGEQTASA